VRNNAANNVRFVLKDEHKYVPVAGWGAYFHDCLFVKRDSKYDSKIIPEVMESYSKNKTPLWLILYPEGSFVTPYTKWLIDKSIEYSKKLNRKIWKNVLLPRVQGFELCLEKRECFDNLINLTVAFEKPYRCRLGEYQPPTMFDFFRENPLSPLNIHIHVKKYKIGDVPNESSKIQEYLFDLFEDKENLLEYFEMNNKFPGDQFKQPTNKLDLHINSFFGLFFWISSSYFLFQYFPKVLLGFVIFLIVSISFILFYDLQHQKKKIRKSKME